MFRMRDTEKIKWFPILISMLVFLFSMVQMPMTSLAAEATGIFIEMPGDMEYTQPLGAPGERIYIKKSNGIDVSGSFTLRDGAQLTGSNAGIYLFVNDDEDFSTSSFDLQKLSEGIKLSEQNINAQQQTFKISVHDNLFANSHPNRLYAVICDNQGSIEGTETFFVSIDTQRMTFTVVTSANSVIVRINETISGLDWSSVALKIDGSKVENYAVNDFEKTMTYSLEDIGNSLHNYSITCKDMAGFEYEKLWQYPTNNDSSNDISTPAPTADKTEKGIASGKSGSVELPNKALVNIPAHLFKEDIKVNIEEIKDIQALISDKNVDLNLLSGVFEFTIKTSENKNLSTFQQPVTLKLKVDKSKISGGTDNLALYYWNEARKMWIFVGGSYNSATNEVEAQVDHFTKFAVFAGSYGYTDIGKHYAKNSIIKLSMMNVFEQGELFKPTSEMTRGEFIVSLVKALDLKLTDVENTGFSDDARISKEEKAYFTAAFEHGILVGIPDGKDVRIGAERKISREEAAAFIGRVLKTESNVELKYKDASKIADWAYGAVQVTYEKGILVGHNNIFNPKHNITKGEVSVVLDKVIRLFGI